MTALKRHKGAGAAPENWRPHARRAGQSVETLELRSGATLVLSCFEPGAKRSFRFTEPDDTFGFGFHLKGGARFEMENGRFETSDADVWAAAAPRGSTSQFALPSDGFRTVSLRFNPQVAEEFFADGLALPQNTRNVLQRAREDVGFAKLARMTPIAAARLKAMFTAPYSGAARHLYLESCALELLAGQIANGSAEKRSPCFQSRHREKALAARAYLDSRLQDPPTIAELSKMVGTNEFTLKQAFKSTFGTTIFSYVSSCRMAHARQLLQQGMSVSSVAHAVGYGCPRSFSAAFRREMGHAPSATGRVTP